MRGQPQAGTARLLAITPGRRWSVWITRAIARRPQISDDRLELIERLAREQRSARRTGEYKPDLGHPRRLI